MKLVHRFGVLLTASVFVLLSAGIPLYGWSYHTHRKICSDALARMPAEFQARFGGFKDVLLRGSTDPDMVIKDFQNHVFHVNGRLRTSEGRVRDLFDQAAGQVNRGDPDQETAYTLGLISHYVADLNQPLHTAGGDMDSDEDEYHAKFEKEVEGRLSKIPIAAIRYDPVSDPVVRLREMAAAAFPGYERIGVAYRRGNKIFDLIDIVEKQYSASVENVIDYWLGIMAQAGRPLDISVPAPVLSVQTADGGPKGTGDKRSSPSLPIDINSATLEQLMDIPGIGEKKAKAILAARPFKSIYDLSKLKGFGVNFIERISKRISVK